MLAGPDAIWNVCHSYHFLCCCCVSLCFTLLCILILPSSFSCFFIRLPLLFFVYVLPLTSRSSLIFISMISMLDNNNSPADANWSAGSQFPFSESTYYFAQVQPFKFNFEIVLKNYAICYPFKILFSYKIVIIYNHKGFVFFSLSCYCVSQ